MSTVVSLSGQVLYMKRDCFNGPESEAPLPDAKLLLTSADGTKQEVALGPDGTYKDVQVSGALPIMAKVVLDSPLVAVAPDIPGGSPYEIQLGDAARLDPATGRITAIPKLVAQGAGPAGASSIFTILEGGAHVAVAVSPVAIPKVTALWRFAANLTTWMGDDARSPSYVDDGSDQIVINGAPGKRGEFTSFLLLHEYGHHLLRQVASPGPTDVGPTKGEHTLWGTYPETPQLPWSEGFADAYAAIAADNPVQTLGCQPAMDLSTYPASAVDASGQMGPQPSSSKFVPISQGVWAAGDRNAQYNETVDAGVVWLSSVALGGGNYTGLPTVVGSDVLWGGFARLLRALNAYHQRYGGPWNMRQVRDAMIIGGAEQSQGDHDAISGAFGAEGIVGFGAGVQTDITPSSDAVCVIGWDPNNPDAGGCEESSVISMTGPGYSCSYRSDSVLAETVQKYTDMNLMSSGGIPNAWQDDCYAVPGAIWLRFPFTAGYQQPGAEYTVTLQISCTSHIVNDPNTGQPANGKCPSTYHVATQLTTRQATGDGEEGIVSGLGTYSATTDVAPGSTVTLASFKADGSSCTILRDKCQ